MRMIRQASRPRSTYGRCIASLPWHLPQVFRQLRSDQHSGARARVHMDDVLLQEQLHMFPRVPDTALIAGLVLSTHPRQ